MKDWVGSDYEEDGTNETNMNMNSKVCLRKRAMLMDAASSEITVYRVLLRLETRKEVHVWILQVPLLASLPTSKLSSKCAATAAITFKMLL